MAATLSRPAVLTDQELIEHELTATLGPARPHESSVDEAMRYAVAGGARLRPLIALRIARLVSAEERPVLRAAISLELLHCASLIVDDLPSMDNSAMRRGEPTVHVVFGEATAILAAFALVALAARSLVDLDASPAHRYALLGYQDKLLRTLDVSGLVGGQELDLRAGSTSRFERQRINEKKTVPLFELAAEAGLLCAGPGAEEHRLLRMFARDYGRAYQVVDDYLDGDIDSRNAALSKVNQACRSLAPFGARAAGLLEMTELLRTRTLACES